MGYEYVVEVWHFLYEGKYGAPDTYYWKRIYEGNDRQEAEDAAGHAGYALGYKCIRTTWRPK